VATEVSLGRVHQPRPDYLRAEVDKHVVLFRRDEGGGTLIVRILHARMLPELHLTADLEE
jgi:plasmid stabilization system protein ParE